MISCYFVVIFSIILKCNISIIYWLVKVLYHSDQCLHSHLHSITYFLNFPLLKSNCKDRYLQATARDIACLLSVKLDLSVSTLQPPFGTLE